MQINMSNSFEGQPKKIFDPEIRQNITETERFIEGLEQEMKDLGDDLELYVSQLEDKYDQLAFTEEMTKDPDISVSPDEAQKIEQEIEKIEKDIEDIKKWIAEMTLHKARFQSYIDNFKELERRLAAILTKIDPNSNN